MKKSWQYNHRMQSFKTFFTESESCIFNSLHWLLWLSLSWFQFTLAFWVFAFTLHMALFARDGIKRYSRFLLLIHKFSTFQKIFLCFDLQKGSVCLQQVSLSNGKLDNNTDSLHFSRFVIEKRLWTALQLYLLQEIL